MVFLTARFALSDSVIPVLGGSAVVTDKTEVADRALLFIDLEPQAVLQESPERRHDPYSSSFAAAASAGRERAALSCSSTFCSSAAGVSRSIIYVPRH
jgi:hypothetical protein